jgi:hypothetical protein
MKSKIPLTISHPNLVLEWDYNSNIKQPDEFTKGSNYKAHWKCQINHSWQATISSRSNGSGCPYCRSSTSLNELMIYSELSFIFPNAVHRYLKDKNEIDIYIPDINIGIEYDGLRWHKDKKLKDEHKNKYFESNGIKIIRIRQRGLPKLNKDDIIVEKKFDAKTVLNILLKKIIALEKAKTFKNEIEEYIKSNKIKNDSKYQELLAYHPLPFKGRSLSDHYPELITEWNAIKNKNLTPNHFYPKSATKVWWVCSKGHEWESRISHRVDGSGCPICSGRIAYEKNNLVEINNILSKEWNYKKNKLKPENCLPNSGKKVWWICAKNHEWQATIASRNSNGVGCPYCSGNIVEEHNSIYYNKKIISIWNFEKNVTINPKILSSNSNKKVWWKCQKGHEWQSIIGNINKGSGCPYCSGLKPTYESSFGNNFPELLVEWVYEKNESNPFELSTQTKKKVWWRCKENHEWETTVQNRVKGTGCPYCSNKIVLESKSVYAQFPELMIEWDFNKNTKYDPKCISIGSGIKVWWNCKNNHSWETAIYHRTKMKTNCPYCINKKISKENSIVETHPLLIKEWDYSKNTSINPEMISYGSTKKVWWKCSKNHNWFTSVGKRTAGRKCPECNKLNKKNK